MPCHTHERRMEAYVYFDFANEDTKVFHMMGKPDETKHLVVAEEQAVISPSWSIILESEQATIPLFGQCAGRTSHTQIWTWFPWMS